MVEKEQQNNYKVFLPCAGIGSRLGEFVKNINKGLISVDNRPIISHLMEKFDEDIEIVVALGYKGEYVKQFLEITYPNRIFTFVTVDNYDKKGSGLGHTLLCCKEYLQCEFIFMVNDLIILDEIPSLQKMAGLNNWLGYSDVKGGIHYRTVAFDNRGLITDLFEKNESADNPTYLGICGIKDYKNFWKFSDTDEFILKGESHSIQKMIENNIRFDSVKFDFYDSGHKEELMKTRKKMITENSPIILEKQGESIWFVGDDVIKFSINENFIKNRFKRSSILHPYVPKVNKTTENMYSYRYVNGRIFSEVLTVENFKFFLDYMEIFWLSKKNIDSKIFKDKCMKFYKDKTYKRIEQYFEIFNNCDSDREVINGTFVPSIYELLDEIDWNWISDGVPVRFHGDLHFENILVSEKNNYNILPFILLDWRQDFCGELEYGDVYYDLAKLMHGLIISHEIINKNLYNFDRSMNEIKYDFLRKNINIDCEEIFLEYIENWGYDVKKVKVMTALIFLNIAKFHHYPYSHLLFYLGKNLLNNEGKTI